MKKSKLIWQINECQIRGEILKFQLTWSAPLLDSSVTGDRSAHVINDGWFASFVNICDFDVDVGVVFRSFGVVEVELLSEIRNFLKFQRNLKDIHSLLNKLGGNLILNKIFYRFSFRNFDIF